MNEDQRNAILIDENTKLRASLSQARVQLARLKSLFDELGTTLEPIGSLPTPDTSEAASDSMKNSEVRRVPRSRTLLLCAYYTEETPTPAAPAFTNVSSLTRIRMTWFANRHLMVLIKPCLVRPVS